LRRFFQLFKRDTGPATAEDFQKKFAESFANCAWEPHPRYSVFTQYDQEYYQERKEAFDKKYRSFYAVARTIAPRKIIELGASAGASADAYLSGAPRAKYLGFDVFGVTQRHDDGKPWDPYEVAIALFQDRRFKNWRLLRQDLRTLRKLPRSADLVVVDAAHDTANEYADLQLALTAKPIFIFVDDADAEAEAKPAIEKFLQEDLAGRVDYTVPIEYMGGGLVIKLKARSS
jgi:predicted O-methyltransferase YrrM